MPYRFLEEIAIADVAFEAWGKTLEELFDSAALAMINTMVSDLAQIKQKVTKIFEVTAASEEMLLFNFLQELIYLKDAELLLFSRFNLTIMQDGENRRLRAEAFGEEISPDRHELLADVKAVSLHNYLVEETPLGWRAEVILDV